MTLALPNCRCHRLSWFSFLFFDPRAGVSVIQQRRSPLSNVCVYRVCSLLAAAEQCAGAPSSPNVSCWTAALVPLWISWPMCCSLQTFTSVLHQSHQQTRLSQNTFGLSSLSRLLSRGLLPLLKIQNDDPAQQQHQQLDKVKLDFNLGFLVNNESPFGNSDCHVNCNSFLTLLRC